MKKEAVHQPANKAAREPSKDKERPTSVSDVLLAIQAPHIPSRWATATKPLMKRQHPVDSHAHQDYLARQSRRS